MTSPGGMGPIQREDLAHPTIDDFEILRDAMLEIGAQDDAIVREVDHQRVGIILERTFMDLDTREWPPLIIRVTGLLATRATGRRMVVSYRQLPLNDKTINSSVNHNYILATRGDEVVEYAHSMLACPQMRSPRTELPNTNNHLDEIARGEKILKANTGHGLELSTGDCTVLFERLTELVC